MLFMTLSDEDGLTEVVAMPGVCARLSRRPDEGASGILIASGRAESDHGAVNLMAESVTAFRPRRREGAPPAVTAVTKETGNAAPV
jgi:hypothetical protein